MRWDGEFQHPPLQGVVKNTTNDGVKGNDLSISLHALYNSFSCNDLVIEVRYSKFPALLSVQACRHLTTDAIKQCEKVYGIPVRVADPFSFLGLSTS